MEWHIPAIARKSYVSEKEFEKDDLVASFLVKGEDGELARIDALVSEEGALAVPGETVCRWTQPFKPKPSDGREEAEALKLTADTLFASLFEGENPDEPTLENAELKFFLALMLERRRVLRVKSRGRQFTRYIHRPSKQEFAVPVVDLDPRFFRENEEKLAFVLEAGADAEAPDAPSKAAAGERGPAQES